MAATFSFVASNLKGSLKKKKATKSFKIRDGNKQLAQPL